MSYLFALLGQQVASYDLDVLGSMPGNIIMLIMPRIVSEFHLASY
jgi:hypothetical protein